MLSKQQKLLILYKKEPYKMILKWIFSKLILIAKQIRAKIKWKKINKSNFTNLGEVFDNNWERTKIGRGTYGGINVRNDRKEYKVVIGNYCSISSNVEFLVAQEHAPDRISTYPFKQMFGTVSKEYREATSKGNIIVDNNNI